MSITAGLPQKQARASPDKTPGCYPWVPVSCYGARDGWFPRNGVWNPARPRGLEVPVLCLRVWQSFHFFADFRPKLFVKKPGKINNNLFFSFRVWNSYLTLIKFELFRDVIATFCETAREKKLYYWYLDAFLFQLKLIDICVEGVAKHRPGACIVYNLRSNVLQISAFKTTEQAPSFSAYKIVCVQAL